MLAEDGYFDGETVRTSAAGRPRHGSSVPAALTGSTGPDGFERKTTGPVLGGEVPRRAEPFGGNLV
jgi:hypothetical protein